MADNDRGQRKGNKKEEYKPKGWTILSLNEFNGDTVFVHGNDYNYHCKTNDREIPPLLVLPSTDMMFFDDSSGEALVPDDNGKLPITQKELWLKVTMESMSGKLTFKSPGLQIIMFKQRFR